MVTTTTAWMALLAGFLNSAAANVFPSKFKLRTILPHSSVGFPTESVYVIAASLALSLNNILYQMWITQVQSSPSYSYEMGSRLHGSLHGLLGTV